MTAEGEARKALAAFALPGPIVECVSLPGGHINATWRAGPWLLQRLNPHVFPDGAGVMENVAAVSRRLGERLHGSRPYLRLLPTRDGRPCYVAADGAIWRVFAFIDGMTHETASTLALAEGAARAFGEFSLFMSEPPLPLRATLPGFHDTRLRLDALAGAAGRDRSNRTAAVQRELDALLRERDLAALIPALLESGGIPTRVAHNDAKIANVLFDDAGAAIAVIDLDTTMPGSPLHDFGDLVRSMASAAPEDAADPALVRVRQDFFSAIVRGFLGGTGNLLTRRERELLVTAARSIVLEQAARFLADHLDGDRYFPVTTPDQNLHRTRAQLALFEGLTREADRLERIVAEA